MRLQPLLKSSEAAKIARAPGHGDENEEDSRPAEEFKSLSASCPIELKTVGVQFPVRFPVHHMIPPLMMISAGLITKETLQLDRRLFGGFQLSNSGGKRKKYSLK